MKVPDRWLRYKPIGKRIPGTRFISFKVPLKQAICNNLDESVRFTPEMLMEQFPSVQLVIDLTNTSRYYTSNVFTDVGVAYKKILTPGQVIPPSRCVLEFFQTVDSFLASSEDEESLIGVHCTHGLNRTSYYVCCYMIHQMGFTPEDAVTAFETARGHKVERLNYVADLMHRGMGSDSGQQPGRSGGQDQSAGPRGAEYRGPQRQDSKTQWAPRPNDPAQWNSRPNNPAQCNPRPNGPAQWNSRPNDPAHWNSRPNGPAPWDSRSNGSTHRDSRSNGSSEWNWREQSDYAEKNWRKKPYFRPPPPDGNQPPRRFDEPFHGHPSSSKPKHISFGNEGSDHQRPTGNVPRAACNPQYSTYKGWRAAREAADQRPLPNQRPPPNKQRFPASGPNECQPRQD